MKMNQSFFKIKHDKKEIECVITQPQENDGNDYWVILTHGAGGDMNFHQLVTISTALAENGYPSLRFTCKGGNVEYRTKVFITVTQWLLKEKTDSLKGCLLAGRSMGSRAAIGASCYFQNEEQHPLITGVICLSYPLHPKGDTNKLRDAPLKEIQRPILFISGTRDDMCSKEEMEAAIKTIPADATLAWIPEGDHGLTVKGQKLAETMEDVCGKMIKWIADRTGTTRQTEKLTFSPKMTMALKDQPSRMVQKRKRSTRNERMVRHQEQSAGKCLKRKRTE